MGKLEPGLQDMGVAGEGASGGQASRWEREGRGETLTGKRRGTSRRRVGKLYRMMGLRGGWTEEWDVFNIRLNHVPLPHL